MPDLKLIALDAEDLSVISAHLQDAALTVGDLAYLPKERRFVALANRFDWMRALDDSKREAGGLARRRAAIRFERVLAAKLQGIDLSAKRRILSLLAIGFEPTTLPEGFVTLHFAQGSAVRLHVECIEASLSDLGAAWEAQTVPEHPGGQET